MSLWHGHMARYKSFDLAEDRNNFPLILASARKLEQLAEFNAIPLGGFKIIAEY